MKLIVQQVNFATIHIQDKENNLDEIRKIWKGVIIYLGVGRDNMQDERYQARIDKFLDKFTRLRCRDDEKENLSASITDTWWELLIVSNFTLYAHYKSGNKMSFSHSAKFTEAKTLYDYFVSQAQAIFPDRIQTGEFGAKMHITSEVAWPVNYILEI